MTENDKKKETQQLVEGLPNWAWQTYFAPQKGLIPQMNKKLSDICQKLDDVEDQVGKHNHFDERLYNVETGLFEQISFCKSELSRRKTIAETEAAVQVRLKEERDDQFKQDWQKFDKTYKKAQVFTAIVGIIVGAVVGLVAAYFF